MSEKLNEQAEGVFIISATPFTANGQLDLDSCTTISQYTARQNYQCANGARKRRDRSPV